MISHEDALNVILSHCCPNGNSTEDGIEGWEFEAHCHTIRIRARLVKEDPENADKHARYKYEIVSLSVSSD